MASGVGLWLGASSGSPATAHAAAGPAYITGQHGESPFYVTLTPAAANSDGARATVDVEARLGNRQDEAMRSLVSVTIEDDRGHTVQTAKISPVVNVAGKQEIHGSALSTPRLADGFYRIRAQAVFAAGKDVRGSETDSLYVEVVNGSAEIIDMSDWHQRSRVNEVYTP